MTQQDYLDAGYLPRDQILNAFNTVLATTTGNPKPRMEIQNLDIMLSVINTNQKGEFQWKQLVQRLFESNSDRLLQQATVNRGSSN